MNEERSDSRREQLLAARARLVGVLSEIAHAAAAHSLTRCPYRTRHDVCTFRGACRNQILLPHAPRHCAGGVLDTRPASPEQVAGALDVGGAANVVANGTAQHELA